MNINDFKHPAALQVDEMILAGAPAQDIMPMIAKLQLVEMESFVRDCIFIDRLFLFESVKACYDLGCLGTLAALAYHMDCSTMGELQRQEDHLRNKGHVHDDSFWGAVRCCGGRAETQLEYNRYPHCARAFDSAFEKEMFEDRPASFNWIFDLIPNRAKHGTIVLSASRWRNRIFQPDVFRSISADNAWLMCQTLPNLRTNVKSQLARQCFLGLSDESDERMDSLRNALWRQGFLEERGSGWGNISCENYLASCISEKWGSGREQSPYLIRDCRFKDVGHSNSVALERFDDSDSIAAMTMGETITGCRARVGDLLRWVDRAKNKLFCQYLPRLASELTPDLVTNIVIDIVYHWPCAAAQQSLPLIERLFPKHIRSMHNGWGYNLLLVCKCALGPNDGKFPLLISLGCDPDEKCLMGYSWNDVQRWEGKKCANK